MNKNPQTSNTPVTTIQQENKQSNNKQLTGTNTTQLQTSKTTSKPLNKQQKTKPAKHRNLNGNPTL